MFNKKNEGEKKKLVIGIDFGTTYCLSAIYLNKKIILENNEKNECFIPSIINFQKKSFFIGKKAKKLLNEDPVNTITSIKRYIGYSLKEIKKKYPSLPYILSENKNGQIIFHTNYGKITVPFIIEKLLEFLKKNIEKKYNQSIYGSVITVPAYFNNIQRNEIRKSAKKINLKILRLLNEPTAAAISYGLEKKKNGIFCIYDLGGGTFDVSILKIQNGIFEVLVTKGHSSLGGDDFDILLAKKICTKIHSKNKINPIFFKKLLIISEKIKKKLSYKEKISFFFENQEITISRKDFENLIEPLIQKTLQITKQSLLDANLSFQKIDKVILVGGSTYIPYIKKSIKKIFKKSIVLSINQEIIVAQGAALHAYYLLKKNNYQNKPILLLDILPISIGIELIGGTIEKMIFKNTILPIEKSKYFTTFKNNQTGFCINIFQGESNLTKNCQLLTQFKIKGLPKKPAGLIRIKITFQIDTDGLLSVEVFESSLDLYSMIKIDTVYEKNNETFINFKNKIPILS